MRSLRLLLAAAVLLSPVSASALDPRLQPVRAHGELLARRIYDATRWSVRVPYELAFPYLVRFKLDAYLDDLPLAEDVRRRVASHVASREFVDEVVPFLIAVQATYSASPADRADDFDAHLRRRFSPADRIPGIEHSMFQWRPAKSDEGGGAGVDPALAARLVTIYDALYLRDRDASLRLGERLACSQPASAAQLAALNQRLQPLVRELLEDLARRFEGQPEIAGAASGVARDPERLDAVTISLVDVINFEVCKHYRVFATRVYREDQLRRWMLAELARQEGGDLWRYLADANDRRRYGVLIVVDGLQGRLVESLARGDAADPFLRVIAGEHANAESLRPAAQASRPAPAQQTEFLQYLAVRGFHHADYLPYFRRLRGARGIARVGISTTPTISVRNVPIALTGAPVAGAGGTGLPNFHYVDRGFRLDGVQQGRAYYFYGNDAALLEDLTRRAGMRTLVERLPWLASFNCASQYDAGAHFTVDGFVNLGVGEKWRDFGETLCLPELRRRARNESELRALRSRLLAKRSTIEAEPRWFEVYERLGQVSERELARDLIGRIAALEQETLPELLVYYNPWPDHFAHFEGPFSDEILSPSGELNRLDFWLGRIAGVYESAGVTERTLFAMAGDHGLAPVFHVLNPEVEVFERMRDRGLEVRVVKISSDEGEGPKLTHRLRPPSMRGWDAVVASTAGGNYMIDFFADQGEGWARQPLRADLERLSLVSGQGPVDILDEIHTALSESLDYLVVRETPCAPEGGAVRLIGSRRGHRADAWITRRGRQIHYRFEGADLLDTGELTRYEDLDDEQRGEHARLRRRCVDEAVYEDESTWCDEADWRRMTSYTDRPDSVVQLAHLYDLDIAGTVNLFPRAGIGYNTIVPGRHAGESFHEKDAFAGAWGAPVRPGPRLRTAVIGSVPMLLYEYLSGEPALEGVDGWGYPGLGPELLRAVAEEKQG